jgi:hypothetical protein
VVQYRAFAGAGEEGAAWCAVLSAQDEVARGPDAEHDSDHHQQQAHRRSPRGIVGFGHIDSHRRDGQGEGDKGDCLHAGGHSGCHARSVVEAWPEVLTEW